MKVLISDTHFGVKQNSLTWLNSQLQFVYNQLIPFCQNQKEKVDIYHLGDVFDSRSSINPFIASKVRKAFKDLTRVVNDIVIIGGNHDYYSPVDDSVDNINIVLHEDDEFKPKIVTKDFYHLDKDLFIPWYKYEDLEGIENQLVTYDIERVFVHADITMIDEKHKEIFKNVQVYSGHIHTPNHCRNLHTLGSTYALTFADCNSFRGFYTLQDKELTFVPNKYSIRFFRLYDDEIFEDHKLNKNDYIELYISQDNLIRDKYTERIRDLLSTYKNCIVIPKDSKVVDESFEGVDLYNIEELCRQCIPDELREKFLSILE